MLLLSYAISQEHCHKGWGLDSVSGSQHLLDLMSFLYPACFGLSLWCHRPVARSRLSSPRLPPHHRSQVLTASLPPPHTPPFFNLSPPPDPTASPLLLKWVIGPPVFSSAEFSLALLSVFHCKTCMSLHLTNVQKPINSFNNPGRPCSILDPSR